MDPNSPEFRKAASELRARAFSETPDLLIQVENALNPEYWRHLNPEMTVCGNARSEANRRDDTDPSCAERPLQMLSSFGYFQMPAIVAGLAVYKMRRCIELTRGAGWHPAFAFLYDEFWWAFRASALIRFLRRALGKDYGQLPYLWGHYVAANSRGWRPHVDGPTDIKKLTVWLALNDATLDNGCIYVVPRNTETEKLSDQFLSIETFNCGDIRALLQNAKALPAAAGSYLGWGPYLIHWGSTSGPQAAARISISAEFSSRHSDPLDHDRTLMDADADSPLPSFSKRLRLIALAIKSYESFDPEVFRCIPLAKQVLAHTTVEKD